MLLLLSALVTLCVFIIQTHPVFRSLSPGLHLDLSLLVVISFALHWGGQRALWFGFATGLVFDALSSQWIGFNMLSKSVTVFVILVLSQNVQHQNPVIQSLFAAVAITLDSAIRLLLLAMFQSQFVALPAILRTLLPHLLLGVILMPIVSTGLRTLAQLLRAEPEKGQGNAAI